MVIICFKIYLFIIEILKLNQNFPRRQMKLWPVAKVSPCEHPLLVHSGMQATVHRTKGTYPGRLSSLPRASSSPGCGAF